MRYHVPDENTKKCNGKCVSTLWFAGSEPPENRTAVAQNVLRIRRRVVEWTALLAEALAAPNSGLLRIDSRVP